MLRSLLKSCYVACFQFNTTGVTLHDCAEWRPDCRKETANPLLLLLVQISKKKGKIWRCGGSNPVPLACKASALPFELHPRCDLTHSYYFYNHNNKHGTVQTKCTLFHFLYSFCSQIMFASQKFGKNKRAIFGFRNKEIIKAQRNASLIILFF